MIDVDDYERLARYQAGELAPEACAAFEHELATRPELAEALRHLAQLDKGLSDLPRAPLDASQAAALVHRALLKRTRSPARRVAVGWLALAAVIALVIALTRRSEVVLDAIAGVVRVDARTLVAGEQVTGPDAVVTSEQSVAVARLESGLVLIAPETELSVEQRSLEHGVLVLQGDGLRFSARATTVTVFGEAVLSTEPLEGGFRETGHLNPGDLVNPRQLRLLVGGVVGASVLVYVLSGAAEIAAPGEAPTRIHAPGTFGAPSSPARAQSPRPHTEFEEWPTETAPHRAPVPASAVDASAFPEPVASGEPSRPKHLDPDAGLFPIDKAGIGRAIRSAGPDLKECYESWLERDPHIGGRMLVGLVISPDDGGLSSSVSHLEIIDGGLGHVLMEGCVMNALAGLKFEADNGVTQVRYPFTFEAHDADGGE